MVWRAVLLFCCYLVLTGTVDTAEIISGIGCALAGTMLAWFFYKQAPVKFRLSGMPWLRLAAYVAGALVRDVPRVAIFLLRPRVTQGTIVNEPAWPQGVQGALPARRAVTVLAASFAPNTILVDMDQTQASVHQLAEGDFRMPPSAAA
jgi:multisubunit Na+/H+ antiporter MnhE subunit